MYDEYEGMWQGGWAMTGIGLALAAAAVTMFILDSAGTFTGSPRADIDIMPIEEEPAEDEDQDED
jgi:hypothetical protein